MVDPSVRRPLSTGYVSTAYVPDVLTSDQRFYQDTDGTVFSGVELMWVGVQASGMRSCSLMESRFTLEKADGRDRVYRRRGERFSNACVKEADRFRGGSVMVWGGIRHNGKTDLVILGGNLTAQRYRDEVLAPVVVPYVNAQNGNVVFQHDNARPHVARLTQQYLRANQINVMNPWPAKSPDLSPIEHVWDELDRRVRRRPVQPQTLRQLGNALVQEWRNIPMNIIRRYLRSMNRRCRAVIGAAGGHTRY